MKCHWCGKKLPEPNYNVVIYGPLTGPGNMKPEDVPTCLGCMKTHHSGKASRMEKVVKR